jgi:hypothetical protein
MGRKNKEPKNLSFIGKIFRYFDSHVQTLNQSKIFAGLMIITLNIVSKFANFKLSRTLESYLKYTFSRQVLVFAIAWMGTRDIYIALFITLCFTVATEHLFHEDSPFFILSEDFRDYHINMLETDGNTDTVTMEDVIKAKAILEKAKKQNLGEDNSYQSYAL